MLRPHPASPANLQRARERIGWVDDEALGDLERRSLASAAALSLTTWGGGHLYVGDTWKGAGMIAGLIGFVALASVLPGGLAAGIYALASVASAVASTRKGRDINRFVRIRSELALRQGPDPSAYRLLSAAAAVDPGLASSLPAALIAPAAAAPRQDSSPYAALADRLRKLVHLHRSGVLNEAELRERKLDLLQEAVPESRAELDDLLYALLPLVDEAVLDAEDFELIKQLGDA